MTWFKEDATYTWIQRTIMYAMKKGPIPRHLAFIMDGNRRFARKMSMQKAEGHLRGFDKLAETLTWCRDFGITEVTVYAFSIENFKRSEEEVECLMNIAKEKFMKLIEEKPKLEKHGICVRIIGNLSLLPLDIRKLAAEVMILTRDHNKAYLNVCMAYTSREEITSAITEVRDGVQSGTIRETDISENLLERCMYMRHSPPVDLLIRTSGETRLSDFLTWQSSFACIYFAQVLWPEFSFWYLIAAVFHYQCHYFKIKSSHDTYLARRFEIEGNHDDFPSGLTYGNGRASVDQYSGDNPLMEEQQRRGRITKFLSQLDKRFWSELLQLMDQTASSS